MGLSDILNAKKIKEENKLLKEKNEELNALLTPEMQNVLDLKQQIETFSEQINELKSQIEGY